MALSNSFEDLVEEMLSGTKTAEAIQLKAEEMILETLNEMSSKALHYWLKFDGQKLWLEKIKPLQDKTNGSNPKEE